MWNQAIATTSLAAASFLYLIRLGIVSKIQNDSFDCSVGHVQSCVNIDGEVNPATERLTFYSFISCCVGLGGCLTILLHRIRETSTSALLAISFLVIVLGLDFLTLGYGAEQVSLTCPSFFYFNCRSPLMDPSATMVYPKVLLGCSLQGSHSLNPESLLFNYWLQLSLLGKSHPAKVKEE